MPKIKIAQTAYRLPVRAVLLYYFVLLVMLMGLLLRNDTALWNSLPLTGMHSWGRHMSNLCLSCLFYTGIGFIWLLQGAPRKAYVWLAVILVVANLLVENFVTVLNTPDEVDALFGVVGTLLGVLVVYTIGKVRIKNQ